MPTKWKGCIGSIQMLESPAPLLAQSLFGSSTSEAGNSSWPRYGNNKPSVTTAQFCTFFCISHWSCRNAGDPFWRCKRSCGRKASNIACYTPARWESNIMDPLKTLIHLSRPWIGGVPPLIPVMLSSKYDMTVQSLWILVSLNPAECSLLHYFITLRTPVLCFLIGCHVPNFWAVADC